MDQDFHYYGTYFAAKSVKDVSKEDAELIAKSANFVDAFTQEKYWSYWELVEKDSAGNIKKFSDDNKIDWPRLSSQGAESAGPDGQDAVWIPFHFLPGNRYVQGSPSIEEVHGESVAKVLEEYNPRVINKDALLKDLGSLYKEDIDDAFLLTRPLSPASRFLIKDSIYCMQNRSYIEKIFQASVGGKRLLESSEKDVFIKKFQLMLLGIRAHVVADTWAHQDHIGRHNVLNTYWGISSKNTYAIRFDDAHGSKREKVLGHDSKLNSNYAAAPLVFGGMGHIGHGWLGHLPDMSFLKFEYKPCWKSYADELHQRDNPTEYKKAWIELVSLFNQAITGKQLDVQEVQEQFKSAVKAIEKKANLDVDDPARVFSARQWETCIIESENKVNRIDVRKEFDETCYFDGLYKTALTRHNTAYIGATSDLYLFHIAADYHFHAVKDFLSKHDLYWFKDRWAQGEGSLRLAEVGQLFMGKNL